MLHDPNQTALFPRLPEAAIAELRAQGDEIALADGEALFVEGESDYQFWVILAGQVRVTKNVGGVETLLVTHSPGEFAGEISMLTGQKAIATGRAVGAARVLRLTPQTLQGILADDSPLAKTILAAMAGRTQDVDVQLQQREKLAALGKLSAGLAHELNNPAAAAQRAATDLGRSILTMQELALALGASPDVAAHMRTVRGGITIGAGAAMSGDALARSDREDDVAAWLDAHNIGDGWEIAPTFVEAGLDVAGLDAIAAATPAATLETAVRWLAASIEVSTFVATIEHSTARIAELVKAVKEYSYMDQAPQQTVDIHDGLENTLTMLGHELRHGITLVRDYDRSLPRIEVYGSELNQVWTNIIDNAVDALHGQGTITVRTAREGDRVLVEIADDGPGIPPEVQHRIFEPFFTTKGVGEGSGLGLDIAYRIVTRHKGELRVTSWPGDTRFSVSLPIG